MIEEAFPERSVGDSNGLGDRASRRAIVAINEHHQDYQGVPLLVRPRAVSFRSPASPLDELKDGLPGIPVGTVMDSSMVDLLDLIRQYSGY